ATKSARLFQIIRRRTIVAIEALIRDIESRIRRLICASDNIHEPGSMTAGQAAAMAGLAPSPRTAAP
ncbi:hypothetical protein, partial [Falsigemmobacter faecalis]|uniref:hypothetical protein n=1 Tax=Falsigemmobacter faecalis TaxID=2488730 RepID=UPI001F2603A8